MPKPSAKLARREAVNVAMTVAFTEAEGPGKRFAVWVQGCPMRCPGCCNPEMLEFEDAQWVSVDELLKQITEARDQHDLEGISLLGGEPFSQPAALGALAASVRAAGMTVMVFSGHTLAELEAASDADVAALLAETDLLVDGRFERDKPDSARRWIGSTNQGTHALSDAYTELVDAWEPGSESLEIRIVDGRLVVNGSPVLLDKLREG